MLRNSSYFSCKFLRITQQTQLRKWLKHWNQISMLFQHAVSNNRWTYILSYPWIWQTCKKIYPFTQRNYQFRYVQNPDNSTTRQVDQVDHSKKQRYRLFESQEALTHATSSAFILHRHIDAQEKRLVPPSIEQRSKPLWPSIILVY